MKMEAYPYTPTPIFKGGLEVHEERIKFATEKNAKQQPGLG
jgi:hypothetical protein